MQHLEGQVASKSFIHEWNNSRSVTEHWRCSARPQATDKHVSAINQKVFDPDRPNTFDCTLLELLLIPAFCIFLTSYFEGVGVFLHFFTHGLVNVKTLYSFTVEFAGFTNCLFL